MPWHIPVSQAREVEAGGSKVQGHLGLPKTLPQNTAHTQKIMQKMKTKACWKGTTVEETS